MSRPLKVALQLLVSGVVLGFLLWRIDLGQTAAVLRESTWAYVLVAVAVFLATTWVMAWRWWTLLEARGVREPFRWLLRMYFVSAAVSQVLPTAIGGDAVRIVEHARRRPDVRATAAGAVVMERILGFVVTVVLVAVALALAAGRYENVRALALVEVVLAVTAIVAGVLLFSPRLGRQLENRLFPLARHVRLERALVNVYRTMHEYRKTPGVLLTVLAASLLVQVTRIGAIWLCGEAVGVDVSPAVYAILGPVLFVVQMLPFTVNGLGVREAFFVAFLASFAVDRETAFAAGFLFYAVSIVATLPGAAILLRESVRPMPIRLREGK